MYIVQSRGNIYEHSLSKTCFVAKLHSVQLYMKTISRNPYYKFLAKLLPITDGFSLKTIKV